MLRRSGTIEMPMRGLKGSIVSTVAGADRSRMDLDFGAVKQTVIQNGARAWIATAGQPTVELQGAAARQQALDHPAALLGDWRRIYQDVQVIARAGDRGDLIVRAVPDEGNPSTFVVNAETGLLQSGLRVVAVPGMGPLGVTTAYSDYREIGGVKFPFRLDVEYDSPLIGTSVVQFERAETKVQINPGAFDAPEPQTK